MFFHGPKTHTIEVILESWRCINTVPLRLNHHLDIHSMALKQWWLSP